MRLWSPSLFLAVFVPFLLFFGASDAAEVRSREDARHNGGARFPFITWLRDTAVEFIFRRPPSKSAAATRGPTPFQRWRYEGQSVIRFNITTPEEEASFSEAADRLFLDIWAFNNITGTVDVRIHEEDVTSLLSLLPRSLQRSFSTLVPDLVSAVWATYPTAASNIFSESGTALGSRPDGSPKFAVLQDGADNVFFHEYQPLPVIVQWMKLLDAMFPVAQVISVGKSAEGRDILGLRLSTPDQKKKKKSRRKTILITGGLHAREWISTSTVSYIAWSFISDYGKGWMTTKLLDNLDIVLVPVVNPDGYEYTWNVDRLWRKTRQGTNFRYCRGLDLDHAFGYEWDDSKAEPCSESYGGAEAFEAVEAKSLSAWAKNQTTQNHVEFVGFLDLHSYSQQIMFPFSYSCKADPPNLENLEELAIGLSKAIRLSTGEAYTIASACEGIVGFSKANAAGPRIESGGGSAIDWFYHELKARYSYQIKLRDTGSYGFLLPSAYIVPTGEEMFSAVKYFGDFLLGNNGIEKSVDGDVDEVPISGPPDAGAESSELRRARRKR